MINLSAHIEYLLLSHDCVVIPGIGALLARRTPAGYDVITGCWTAPMRTFAFNPNLCESDGLLAWSVARGERVSTEVAARRVDDIVELMRRNLASGRPVTLGRVGTLTADGASGVTFIPGEACEELSPKLMWMPRLRLPYISQAIKEEARQIAVAPTTRRRSAWRAVRAAAAIVLLVAIGAVITLPISTEHAQRANLAPASAIADKQSTVVEMPGRTDAPIRLMVASIDDAVTTVDSVEYKRLRSRAHAVKATDLSGGAERYCLVVASLTSMSDAESFVNKNSDLDLRILTTGDGGPYRVYAATAATAADLQSAVAGISDRFPGAWVCRRR